MLCSKARQTESSEDVILQHLPLVKMIAGRLFARIPKSIDFEDLVGYGILGLIEAYHDYDAGKNVKFSTFAFYRVRGAMLDGLRALDWLPRPTREKMQRIKDARVQLEGTLCRMPSDEEIAAHVKLDAGEVSSLIFEEQQSRIISLEEIVQETAGAEQSHDGAEASKSAENKELGTVLTDAIGSLDERDRLIVTLYYYEGLNLKEIGRVLDIGESRVSQLLAAGIETLSRKLQHIKQEMG